MSTRYRYGFTGTQKGTTLLQRRTLFTEMCRLADEGFVWQHNGDCVGADAQAYTLWKGVDEFHCVYGHPPIIQNKRAFLNFDELASTKDYLARNHDIVKATSLMVACPGEMDERIRSGTWSTIRYADKLERPLIIIFPDGSIERRNFHEDPFSNLKI